MGWYGAPNPDVAWLWGAVRPDLADSFTRFIESRKGAPFLAQISFHNCHVRDRAIPNTWRIFRLSTYLTFAAAAGAVYWDIGRPQGLRCR